MATVTVRAPVEDYDGVVAGVQFEKGKAEVERDSAAYRYFRSAGYHLDGAAPRAEAPEPPDPRDLGTDGDGVEVVGTRLRDAAVDPQPTDFLPPINAGNENPHGPLVVSPGLHGIETGPIAPGPVPQDPRAQEAKETDLATAVFVDQQPVPQATADVARDEGVSPARTVPAGERVEDAGDLGSTWADGDEPGDPQPPKRSASTDTWRAYATDGAPEADRLDPDVAKGMSRDELAEHYLGRKEG